MASDKLQPSARSDEATPEPGLRYKIEATPFRGKTVISLYQLPPGEPVIMEGPIIAARPRDTPLKRGGPLRDDEPGLGEIERALKACPWPDKLEEFWKLSNAYKTKKEQELLVTSGIFEGREDEEEARRLVGIWRTNAYSPYRGVPFGIYLGLARVNYSCSPNCCVDMDEQTGTLWIRALKVIEVGEEVTVNYVSLLKPFVLRSICLELNYSFRCTCTTCSLPANKRDESDQNRVRADGFDQLYERWKAGKCSGRSVLMEGVELLKKGGIFDQEGILGQPRSQFWQAMFHVAAAHSSRNEAIGCAKQFVMAIITERGREDRLGLAEQYTLFANSPEKSPLWATRIEPMDPSLIWAGVDGAPTSIPLPPPAPADLSWIEEDESVTQTSKSKKKNKKKKKSKSKATGAELNGADAASEPECPSEPSGTTETPKSTLALAAETPLPACPLVFAADVPPSTPQHLPSCTERPSTAFASCPVPPVLTSAPTASKDSASFPPPAPEAAIAKPLPPSPAPASPPSRPVFDARLTTVAAPPVSVNVSTDELSKLAARRAAEEERHRVEKSTKNTIDDEGEWEKWPEEKLEKWKKDGEDRRTAEERRTLERQTGKRAEEGERVLEAAPLATEGKENEPHPQGWAEEPSWGPSDPIPAVQQQPTHPPPPSDWRNPLGQITKPRSKAVLRKEARKTKLTAGKQSANSSFSRLPPGLPRPAPSSYAELVTPLEHAKEKEVGPALDEVVNPRPLLSAALRLRPSLASPTPSIPRLVAPALPSQTDSSSTIFVSRLPFTPRPAPKPFTDPSTIAGSGWIVKSPPTHPHPVDFTTLKTPIERTTIRLATSAFLRKPSVPMPCSPITPPKLFPSVADPEGVPQISPQRSIEASGRVETAQESPSDPLASLGLVGASQPQSLLTDDNDQFDDADEAEKISKQRSTECELESVEEKMARMEGGLADGEKPALPEEDHDHAFSDADEEQGGEDFQAQEGMEERREGHGAEELSKPLIAAGASSASALKKFIHLKQGLSWTYGLSNDPILSPTFDNSLVADAAPSSQLPPAPPSPPASLQPTGPPLVPIPTTQHPNLDASTWRPWPNSVLAARKSARPLETPVAAEAYLPNPPPVPIPPVKSRVEGWLSSTQEAEKRNSQRRKLVDILTRGETESPETAQGDVESRPEVDEADITPPIPLPPLHLNDPAIVRVDIEQPASPALSVSKPPPVFKPHTCHETDTASSLPLLPLLTEIVEGDESPIELEGNDNSAELDEHPVRLELRKLERSLDYLPPWPRAVILANLERIKSYPSDLPLSCSWSLYYSDFSRLAAHSATNNVAQTRLLTAKTVSDLLGSLKALAGKLCPPGSRAGLAEFLKQGTSLAFFREDAEPTWESSWNVNGGRLVFLLPDTSMFDPIFERLMLLLAGDTLAQNIFSLATMGRTDSNSGDEGVVIGAVANRRKDGDRIEVWVGGAVKGPRSLESGSIGSSWSWPKSWSFPRFWT